jgi:hypothetical protein
MTMNFALTRDSIVLYLGLVGTILTYMLASPVDVGEWKLREWLQCGLLVVSWLTGKLQTSPLPHSEEGDAKITLSGK